MVCQILLSPSTCLYMKRNIILGTNNIYLEDKTKNLLTRYFYIQKIQSIAKVSWNFILFNIRNYAVIYHNEYLQNTFRNKLFVNDFDREKKNVLTMEMK